MRGPALTAPSGSEPSPSIRDVPPPLIPEEVVAGAPDGEDPSASVRIPGEGRDNSEQKQDWPEEFDLGGSLQDESVAEAEMNCTLPDLSAARSARPCETTALAQLECDFYLQEVLKVAGSTRRGAANSSGVGAKFGRLNSDINLASGRRTSSTVAQAFPLTALEAASQRGHVANVKLLLNGLDAIDNFSTDCPEKAAALAVDSGATDVLQLLVENGAVVNSTSHQVRPPIVQATRDGRMEMVQSLCMRDDVDVNAKDARGFAALHYAVLSDNLPLASILLSRQADPSVANARGWTPLHLAAHLGNAAAMKDLLQARASVDGTASPMQELPVASTAAAIAPPLIHEEEDLDGLKSQGIGPAQSGTTVWPPLHLLISKGQPDLIRQLIGMRADPCQVGGPNLVSPLMLAISRGLITLALQLLSVASVRAQADYRDRRGRTALHFAVQAKARPVVKGLLDINASPSIADHASQTPLDVGMADQDNHDVVRMLQVEEIVNLVIRRCVCRRQNRFEEAELVRGELRLRGVVIDVQKERWRLSDGTWGHLSTERSRAQAQGGPALAAVAQ